jgi:hypothetical protein
MPDNLSGRAAELAHLTDLIRTSFSLADAAIPLLNEQLHALAEMGIDNLQLGGAANLFPHGRLVADIRRQTSTNRAGNDSGRCPDTDRRTSLMLPRAGSVTPGLLISRPAAA